MLATDVPLDPIVRELKRGRCYTLGLGRATLLADGAVRAWPERVAQSLRSKTLRRVLLVETEECGGDGMEAESSRLADRPAGDTDSGAAVTRIRWSIGSESGAGTASGRRKLFVDLAALPKWKLEYPLVILHLGSLQSEAFGLLGKLCDGIALAADVSNSEAVSLAELSRSLRHHQSHGCRMIGMWSVEIG